MHALAACQPGRALSPPESTNAPPEVKQDIPSHSMANPLGINEGVSVPAAWIKNRVIDTAGEKAELLADVQAAQKLGATMVRANSPVFPFLDMQSMVKSNWDWGRADAWVQAVQTTPIEALVVLGPWPGNRTAAHTDHYVPDNMDDYADYIRRVVERYDGDGEDDMPGLVRPIRYWEVDNEPDLHNSVMPRGISLIDDPSQFETPAQYAGVLVASAAAIRSADPNAVVLSGGMYRPRTDTGRKYLKAVLNEPGVMDAFDILSLHCYFDNNSLDPIEQTMAVAHELAPTKPVWITETGVPSSGKRSWIDVEWQATMVAAIVGGFLANGAERIFWHTLSDPPARAKSSPFSTHSLMQTTAAQTGPRKAHPGNQKVAKPAGEMYERLALLLANRVPAETKEVPAIGGRLLWTGSGWLAFWGTPNVPSNAASVENLRTGDITKPQKSVVSPAWISLEPPRNP